MEFELQPTPIDDAAPEDAAATEDSSFSLSSRPVVARVSAGEEGTDPLQLPRSYGTQTLCLMARDPKTLFAYWDIDWTTAFRDESPRNRKVQLRILNDEKVELSSVEVEPMAGNCNVTVTDADAVYQGEIGYFNSTGAWKVLASSEVVTTPADSISATEEVDFATVPFHLSFQHMIDLLKISKQENESLTTMLAELRERAASNEGKAQLSAEERDLAQVMEKAASTSTTGSTLPGKSDFWTQERIQRVLGIGGSSPSEGFGGGGGNAGPTIPFSGLGGSSRAI